VKRRRSIAAPAGLLFAGSLLASLTAIGIWYDRQAESTTAEAISFLDRDLAREGWSAEVRQVTAWAIRENDHAGLPFVVIDQARGRVFAFDARGRLAGSTPILRSPEWADDGAPPGRFVADTRRSVHAGAIVWANERHTVALLAAPPGWKRQPVAVQYHGGGGHGRSLHVAGEFYHQHLQAFRQQAGVAYVLPGTLEMRRSPRVYAGARPAPHLTRSTA
jgi:hypothetical protein